MRMTLRVAVWFALPALFAAAQPAAGQGQVSRIVINSLTGEPVNRAYVWFRGYSTELQAGDGSNRPSPHRKLFFSTFTDASGKFQLDVQVKAQNSIWAQKPQFELTEIVSLTLPDSKPNSKPNVTLKLAPRGVITGKVVDESGEPMDGVNVVALEAPIQGGLRRILTLGTNTTDDRGVYRLWGLLPGTYFVKVAGRSAVTYYAGYGTPPVVNEEGFAPAYYGGGVSQDSATPIKIEVGTQAHADIAVKLRAGGVIHGSIANFVPGRSASFKLLSQGEDLLTGQVFFNADSGHFEIHQVVPGAYTLLVSQGDATAETPVNVSGAEVTNVNLSLTAAVEIKGTSRTIAADHPNPRHPRRVFCDIELDPGGTQLKSSIPDPAGAPGAFVIPAVSPGRYRVQPLCSGGYVQSMAAGTQDLLSTPVLTLSRGVPPPQIEMVVKPGGGGVHGKISLHSLPEGSPIRVLLVPQSSGSDGPALVNTVSGSDSEFEMTGLAPGKYLVYAFFDRDNVEYLNPAFLQKLRGGTIVEVDDDGAGKEVNITEVIR